MKAVPRIRTKRTLIERLWDAMEVSWWPAIVIYAIAAVVLIAAKWNAP
jgi:hypothetical protein